MSYQVLRQCKHTKTVRLPNNIEVNFFFNEWGNKFLGHVMFDGIPMYAQIAIPENKKEGFEMVKKADGDMAENVVGEILNRDIKTFSLQDLIDYHNGNL